MLVTKSCLNCSKSFDTNTSEIIRGNGKFCCRSCGAQFYAKKVSEHKKLNPNCKCSNCNLEFYINKKRRGYSKTGHHFCSRKCKDSFPSPLRKFVTRSCNVCKNNFDTKSHSSFYECKICRKELKEKLFIEAWLSGKNSGSYKNGEISNTTRDYIFKTRGRKCEICGWAEINTSNNTIPVSIHHINGNWRDNRPENLQVLCPNHHSLTPNYGSRNKGNGRPNRRVLSKYGDVAELVDA